MKATILLINFLLCLAALAESDCPTIDLPSEISNIEATKMLEQIPELHKGYVTDVKYYSETVTETKNGKYGTWLVIDQTKCFLTTSHYIFVKSDSNWQLEKFPIRGTPRGCTKSIKRRCETIFNNALKFSVKSTQN